MACGKHKHDEKKCRCCPPRPIVKEPKTLTYSHCVPVSDTSNTANNVIFSVDTGIEATIAASVENTGTIGFNVLLVFNSGPSLSFTLQPGDSITFIYHDVRTISTTGFSPTEAYHGIFNYQVTYTFDV